MKKILLLTGAMLALTVSLACAAGLNLGWVNPADGGINTCPSSATSLLDMGNTCTSNALSVGTMIGSIVSPGVPNVVGELVVIDMQESGVATLSDWWNFADGACRGLIGTTTASASINTAFDPLLDDGPLSTGGNCNNLWGLGASAASSYQGNFPSGGRARWSMAAAVSNGQDWLLGTEWYSFRLTIDKRHTVGTVLPLCAGCQDGACFTFQIAQINSGNPGSDKTLDNGAAHQSVSYRGGGALNCATATPAKRATWGQVKSLYR